MHAMQVSIAAMQLVMLVPAVLYHQRVKEALTGRGKDQKKAK
jgi:hypothetical protein